MVSLAQKIKLLKRCQKGLQRHLAILLCKKWLQKTPNVREKTSFRKWPQLPTMQRLQAFQNGQFGSKIKIAKNMPKTSLETPQSCSVQKTAPENTQYWRNDNFSKIAKIGHNAKAIGFAKWSVWLKIENCQKHAKNVSRDTLKFFCTKNGSKKHLVLEK